MATHESRNAYEWTDLLIEMFNNHSSQVECLPQSKGEFVGVLIPVQMPWRTCRIICTALYGTLFSHGLQSTVLGQSDPGQTQASRAHSESYLLVHIGPSLALESGPACCYSPWLYRCKIGLQVWASSEPHHRMNPGIVHWRVLGFHTD